MSVADAIAHVQTMAPDMVGGELPGFGVVIVHNDAIWQGVYGTLGHGNERLVDAETLFSVQSISKTYVAILALLAVRSGLVRLDEPLDSLLPGFRVRSRFEEHPERRITLRHLLSHTAGFTHEAPIGSNRDPRQVRFEDHVLSIQDTWLRWPIGERYEYSNLGFDIAGYALERRGGLPLPTLFDQMMCQPLGLSRSTMDYRVVEADDNRALGHAPQGAPQPTNIPMVAAGGVWTASADIGKFLHALTGGSLLTDAERRVMAEPPFPAPGQRFGYGLGLEKLLLGGHLVLGHSGGGFGFLADLYWAPDAHVGVAVVTNSTLHQHQGRFAFALLRQALDAEPRGEPTPPAGPSVSRDVLKGLTGEYVGRFSALTFTERDGILWMTSRSEIGSSDPIRVHMTADTEGWVERLDWQPGDTTLMFVTAASGPSHVVSGNGSTWAYNAPVPLTRTDRKFAEAHSGVYAIPYALEPDRRLRLWLEDGSWFLGPGAASERLTLQPYRDGLWFSSTGEALDFTADPPTFGAQPLIRQSVIF